MHGRKDILQLLCARLRPGILGFWLVVLKHRQTARLLRSKDFDVDLFVDHLLLVFEAELYWKVAYFPIAVLKFGKCIIDIIVV